MAGMGPPSDSTGFVMELEVVEASFIHLFPFGCWRRGVRRPRPWRPNPRPPRPPALEVDIVSGNVRKVWYVTCVKIFEVQ